MASKFLELLLTIAYKYKLFFVSMKFFILLYKKILT
jgi:hypothetical protein